MDKNNYKAYNEKRDNINNYAGNSDEEVLRNFCEAAVEYSRIQRNSTNSIGVGNAGTPN